MPGTVYRVRRLRSVLEHLVDAVIGTLLGAVLAVILFALTLIITAHFAIPV